MPSHAEKHDKPASEALEAVDQFLDLLARLMARRHLQNHFEPTAECSDNVDTEQKPSPLCDDLRHN
jgi:hypothetical protein